MRDFLDPNQDDEIPASQLLEPMPGLGYEQGAAQGPGLEAQPMPPPTPEPEPVAAAPAPRPTLSRENLARAFGPRPGAPDWADLKQRMERAYGNASTRASVDNFLTNLGGNSSFGGGYKPSTEARQLELKAAALPMEMAEAQQKYELTQANIDKAFRPPQRAEPSQLELDRFAEEKRRNEATETENKRYHDLLAGKGTEDPASLQALKEAWLNTPEGKRSSLRVEDLARVTRREDFDNLIKQIDPAPKPGKGAGAGHKVVASLDEVPAEYRGTVQAIIDGRAKAPDPGSRFGATILNYVTQIDPSFDSTRFGNYAAVGKQQATDKGLVAVDVAKSHIARARSNIPDNFDSRALNRIKQVFQTNTGSDKLSAFELDLLASAHELASVYGIGNLEGQRAVEHLLDPNQSKAQLQTRLAEAEELMRGKLEGAERQRAKYAPRGSTPAATGAGQSAPKIRVRLKSTGQTGNLLESDFDPEKYERLDE